MTVLELCPCCGDYAFLMRSNSTILQDYDLPNWYIQCHGCGLRTTKGEKEEVIERWNRRVSNEAIDSDDEAQKEG